MAELDLDMDQVVLALEPELQRQSGPFPGFRNGYDEVVAWYRIQVNLFAEGLVDGPFDIINFNGTIIHLRCSSEPPPERDGDAWLACGVILTTVEMPALEGVTYTVDQDSETVRVHFPPHTNMQLHFAEVLPRPARLFGHVRFTSGVYNGLTGMLVYSAHETSIVAVDAYLADNRHIMTDRYGTPSPMMIIAHPIFF